MKKFTLILMMIISILIVGFNSKNKEVDNNKPNKKLEKIIMNNDNITEDNKDRYIYFHEDLNDDKKDEILVFLWGDNYSGTGGKTLMVFNNKYDLISRTTVVNMPIIISKNKTNGYKNIMVKVEGGGVYKGFYSLLKYENKRYPLNASMQEKVNLDKNNIKRIINMEITPKSGFKLN
ncbi:hypothetical protein [Terrisporobacter petrolearius]|uniref:hypothetical protein n=1 Tax=Terrisporobacter petrolearius TaxID=1460447 RepID=UPI0031CC8E5C